MKKKIFTIGAIIASTAPILSVVSCSDDEDGTTNNLSSQKTAGDFSQNYAGVKQAGGSTASDNKDQAFAA